MKGPTTRTRIESAIRENDLAAWKAERYRAFHRTMTDEEAPFPCYFAVDAHRDGDLRYLFAPSATTETGKSVVADGLARYLDGARGIADITALAAFFESPDGDLSVADYRERVWDLLAALRRNDPEPWPDDVPADPDDPEWEFCYAGEPMFVVARAPAYDRRHSRHAPHGLELTVQPRWVFDGLGSDTEAGQQARAVIRERLDEYDNVPRHPAIGDYGDPDTREWKQYVLSDDNDETFEEFPVDNWDT
ncbi:YqcI/YcgG family protein [Halorussus gelatinilyticus]|uniref:YqcI/YcgG family protein n=1 Tax=Halorussus gelatinilyticus TaxID=2937524 RepID=A0A8U0IL30_9EURY|nr:YqcI/YcgG family protein [Halorussus gelatinilyticus]UPW00749.1 YqcI/YcgG family protein [Halorussus gelatinilyticus]